MKQFDNGSVLSLLQDIAPVILLAYIILMVIIIVFRLHRRVSHAHQAASHQQIRISTSWMSLKIVATSQDPVAIPLKLVHNGSEPHLLIRKTDGKPGKGAYPHTLREHALLTEVRRSP